ncbi:Thioredoxin [Penicillium diatomitis]|uniref:Thioredoxin n=1 Tax=Penicillium diatomitis TaxID=2819901 RepID=A0A9W9WTX8_9EURO|nr:Thioredoxin [Penicillium diatomitis]KAJ5475430.1 Thioredoxin [Penicillium diatomitis]
MPVEELTSMQDFLDKVLNAQGPVVIDAWATWCGPCRMVAPVIEKLSDAYPQIKFYKLDVDAVPDVSQELGVRAMPTIFFFKDGGKVTEVVGTHLGEIDTHVKALVQE